MNKLISYIDNQVIREHAYKSRDGYSLFVNDLDKTEQENFIDWLFNHDEVTRDLLLDRAQELINQRLPIVESKDKYNSGLIPKHDRQTGEVIWIQQQRGL